jgi:hypothetical protein
LEPSKAARFQAAPLEAQSTAARAEVIATELLLEQFVAVDHAQPDLNLRLGWIATPTLAHRFEKTTVRWNRLAWRTSFILAVVD